MIIAAYAGCGKTSLATKHSEQYIEVVSMPYTRILPIQKEDTSESFEREKAAPYHVNHPLYPYNMIEAILEAEKTHKYVIIPTIQPIIETLQAEYKRNVILCYPDDELEEEYRERYLKRGNTEAFCCIFVDRMKDFLKNLKCNKKASHVVLKSGEYLTDKLEEFEKIYKQSQESVVKQEKIDNLKHIIEKQKKNACLHIGILYNALLYYIEDIDSMEERQFIYDFGKQLYEIYGMQTIYTYNFDIREVIQEDIQVVDKVGLWMELERIKAE